MTAETIASGGPAAPLAYRRRAAARALGVSVDTIDRLIARGELKSGLVGSARVIPASALQAYLERSVEG